jgi:dTMP kinase
MNSIDRGRFIVVEGIDGSGKSTVCKALKISLEEHGETIYLTKEPTENPIGSLIRLHMSRRVKFDERVIALLFAADRIDHIVNDNDGIMKYLDAGTTVISDRYYHSSFAYHRMHCPTDWIHTINSYSTDLLRPDFCFFIDVSPKTSLERIQRGRHTKERYESESQLQKVRSYYHEALKDLESCENIVFIDGERPSPVVVSEVVNFLKSNIKD